VASTAPARGGAPVMLFAESAAEAVIVSNFLLRESGAVSNR
jgi:hypothetical protein